MRSLIRAIADGAKLKAVQFGDVVETARANGLFDWLIPAEGDLDAKAKPTLARLLKSYDRRIIGSHRFTLLGKGAIGAFKWRN